MNFFPDTHKTIQAYDLEDDQTNFVLREDRKKIKSFTLDDSDQYALVNIPRHVIIQFDILKNDSDFLSLYSKLFINCRVFTYGV